MNTAKTVNRVLKLRTHNFLLKLRKAGLLNPCYYPLLPVLGMSFISVKDC